MPNDIFANTREQTQPHISTLVPRILPQGKRVGNEWVALNPTRHDRKVGSFKINLNNGRWSDFATGDSGGDLISLAGYLYCMSPKEAAKYVCSIAGVANDL